MRHSVRCERGFASGGERDSCPRRSVTQLGVLFVWRWSPKKFFFTEIVLSILSSTVALATTQELTSKMWENWRKDDKDFAILIRPYTDNDFPFLVEQFGILGQNGRTLLRVAKTTTEASFRGHFQARLTECREYSEFLGLQGHNAKIPEHAFVGFSVDPENPKKYDRIQAFLHNPLRQEGDKLMPADSGKSLSHAAIPIVEARRIWDGQREDEAAEDTRVEGVDKPADTTIAITSPHTDPPMPMDPLMAILQQVTALNGKFTALDGRFEEQRQQLLAEQKKVLEDQTSQIQAELRPIQSDITGLYERQKKMELELAALKAGQTIKGTNNTAIPPSSAPPILDIASESPALRIQRALNKFQNPAARDERLVQRTIDFDTKLRLDEFRPAQLHREDIQLSLGNGQSLMIQNTRANRF
ncbi:MAG: hypothetical protein GY696_11700, partial [Gammaproteobacteria bacterium]|nr:hypothetical protein [Gammaproteobacteria bacterium]